MNTDNDWFYCKNSDPLEVELSNKQKRIIQLEKELTQLRKEVERLQPYYLAIDDALITAHLGIASSEPKKDLDRLAKYEQGVGLFFGTEKIVEMLKERASHESILVELQKVRSGQI